MTFKPLILSGPMMVAHLDGAKTMTRRVIKNLDLISHVEDGVPRYEDEYGDSYDTAKVAPIQPGDFIWWKEKLRRDGITKNCIYDADYQKVKEARWYWKNRVLPSIFMPKFACRAMAEVTGVRAQQIQSISPEDAIAEGVEREDTEFGRLYYHHNPAHWSKNPEDAFEDLWDSLHGPGAWERNDWVWIYTFRPLEGDELKEALEVLNGH